MSSPLARLWTDRMDIYRWVDVVDDGGITSSEKQLLYEDVKCRYSKGSLVDTGTQGVPTIVNSYTLFCDISVDLQEGDEVVVTQRNGRQTSLSIGEGFPYTGHKEFRAKRVDTA